MGMAITARTLRLAQEVRKIIAKLLSSLTRAFTAGWSRAWDRLAGKFADAVKGLLASNKGKWPTRRQLNQSAPLNAALKAATTEHDQLVTLLRTSGTEAAQAAVTASSTAQAGLIDSQLPTGHARTLEQATDDALSTVVRRADGRITSLSKSLTRDVIAGIRNELARGIRSGEDPDELIRLMVRRLEGEFATGLTRALVIAQTEVQDAQREAARLARIANADVLRGWVWLSRLAPNTCGGCWAMHGTEHPLDEFGPLDHPNGQCYSAPLTKTWKELGFNFPETPSAMPDAQAAFAALSRSQQLAVMGPTRLDLLDRGEISWTDLATRRENPGWRPSYGTTPVRDLLPT